MLDVESEEGGEGSGWGEGSAVEKEKGGEDGVVRPGRYASPGPLDGVPETKGLE